VLACIVRVTNRVRVSLGFRDRVRVKVRVSFRLATFMYSVWPPVSVRVMDRVRVSVLRLLYGLGIRLGLVLGFRDRVRVKVRVSFRIVTFAVL